MATQIPATEMNGGPSEPPVAARGGGGNADTTPVLGSYRSGRSHASQGTPVNLREATRASRLAGGAPCSILNNSTWPWT